MKLRYCPLVWKSQKSFGISVLNGKRVILSKCKNFELSRFCDLDLGLGRMDRAIVHHLCIIHRPLTTSQISFKLDKTFCGWVDVRNYVWKYRHQDWL